MFPRQAKDTYDSSKLRVCSNRIAGWLSEEMLIPEMCIHQANVNLGCAEAPAICNPSNPARGDAHYYTLDPSVAFNASAMLPPAKFVSENGVESYASLKPLSTVRNRIFCAIVVFTKNDRFTKTGSGQT